MENPIVLKIPIKLLSTANISAHWTKRFKFNQEMKRMIRYFWNIAEIRDLKPPKRIKLIRHAMRSLDYDNLVYAFKTARDTIADLLIPGLAPGLADGSNLLEFEYDQKKSKEYFVEIIIEDL